MICEVCGSEMKLKKWWECQSKTKHSPLFRVELYKCPKCGAVKRKFIKLKDWGE